MQKAFVVVIPTRNRADFAINAINSVITQKDCQFEIVVSDNSTNEKDVSKLSNFCRELNDERLSYIRPEASLPMTEHWDWAMRQTLKLSTASHVIYLTDRLIFRPFALRDLAIIADFYPEKVISYSWDLISDLALPILSFQLIRTQKLYEVSSEDLLDLSAKSVFNYSLPRMLNTCCPRNVVEAVHEKYGYYFFSDNPDFNFAYTCLDIEDSILFYDYPLIISYGLSVSNGTTFLRGLHNKSETTKDFVKTIKINETNANALIAKLPMSTTKFIAYEYNLIKQLSGSGKFKDLDENRLFRKLINVIMFYEDKQEQLKAFKEVFSMSGGKFPWYLLQAYSETYSQRLTQKLKSKARSTNALEIRKTHQSLDEAIADIINHPRQPTSDRSFFDIRIGCSPRELKNATD